MEIIQLEEGGEQSEQKDLYTNQLQFVFEPIKDWHITIDGSMRQTTQSTQWAVLPIYGYDADNNPYLLSWNGGAAGYSEVQDYRSSEDYFSTNIYSDYSKTIGDHYFKVMAGFNAELYKTGSLTGFGTDLITPTVPELNTTQDNKNTYNSASELAIAGFFGRVNYNYKERYMLEANLRYDACPLTSPPPPSSGIPTSASSAATVSVSALRSRASAFWASATVAPMPW